MRQPAEGDTRDTYPIIERAMDSASAVVGPLLAIALVASVGLRWTFALTLIPGLIAALLIIFRCGTVQSRLRLSRRTLNHSHKAGRWRLSGLAFQADDRSARRSSARPRLVSRCLRVSHSRREGTR